MDAALGYHLTWEDLFSQTEGDEGREHALSLTVPCKTVNNSLGRSVPPWFAVLHISGSTTSFSWERGITEKSKLTQYLVWLPEPERHRVQGH